MTCHWLDDQVCVSCFGTYRQRSAICTNRTLYLAAEYGMHPLRSRDEENPHIKHMRGEIGAIRERFGEQQWRPEGEPFHMGLYGLSFWAVAEMMVAMLSLEMDRQRRESARIETDHVPDLAYELSFLCRLCGHEYESSKRNPRGKTRDLGITSGSHAALELFEQALRPLAATTGTGMAAQPELVTATAEASATAVA
jgi:hypothetical protein